ncbi:protein disulfide isomerase [Pseudovirgaria hyperparasitica]|uniref:Protein disulfide isomerase n=1 Tax=Pseudovirgaria hyperparasitica TaxID=470096 RepID=A0A6A6WLC3_9PEZI|nr:protein disulfide isomerase [Pseudovirgaria hyperparasitica]KAF2762972.1 protein disulfide isomerase [Pseudovirgaria hyperparasitica]
MNSQRNIRLALLACIAFLFAFVAAADAEQQEGPPQPTKFNGIEVPPIVHLTGDSISEAISTGNWLIEFYSPYCGHCQAMAPIYQTAYEYYYTSNPVPGNKQVSDDSLNTFSRYYDFKFAKIDCISFGDACQKYDGLRFPTFKLFKNGEETSKHVGGMDINVFSGFVEDCLETIRPGSRPKEGVKLPKVGATQTDDAATKPEVSEEKDKNPAAGSAMASAHRAVATPVTAKPEAALQNQAPIQNRPASKDNSKANLQGDSVPLDAEAFQKKVTATTDAWFIKFYAPWCGHCKALAPNWKQMAKEMQGRLNVGEVNCEQEKRLCKEAGVKGYPTMLFFRGGERVEYEGLRGVGDLISYASRATEVNEGVVDVNFDDFVKMEETEEVIFLYFYDHATTSEDLAALDRLTLSLVGHAKLVKTNDKKLVERFGITTWPRLVVSRDSKPTYFTPLAPKDIRDVKKVLSWMMQNWLPIVPELTSSNAVEIMEGRLVVLAVLTRDNDDEFISAKRELKNAAIEWIDKQTHMMQLERQELRDAKQLRIEEAEDRDDERALSNAKRIRIDMDEIKRTEVGFAWVDGVFWDRWIRTTYGIDAKDGPKVIINDEDNRQYWDVTINGDPIRASRTSISETLRSVTANPPKISPKSTSSPIMRVYYRFIRLFTKHPIIMGVAMLVSTVLGILYSRRARRGRTFGETGGYFNLSEKGGLLNGGTGGKTD